MELTGDKLIALGVAMCFCTVCWIHMLFNGAMSLFFVTPVVVLSPLAIIWFDDVLGSISGIVPRAGYMSESSPIAIRFLGWISLLGYLIHEMVTGSPWESSSWSPCGIRCHYPVS